MATGTIVKPVNASYSVITLGAYAQETANVWEDTGLTITVPTGHIYVVAIDGGWSAGRPVGLGVNPSASLTGGVPNIYAENDPTLAISVNLYPGTWHVFTKRAAANVGSNNYYARILDISI